MYRSYDTLKWGAKNFHAKMCYLKKPPELRLVEREIEVREYSDTVSGK